MQHDGEAGQTLGDFLQNVEAQRGRNKDAVGVAGALLGLELVSAVAGADGDGKRVAAGLGDELLDLLGMGVGRLVRRDLDLVLNAGEVQLQIAGIMSEEPLVDVNRELENAKEKAFALGVSRGVDPFMTLSFMALPVIPTLRLTTRGVFDTVTQKYV